jgi:hypothetical protein
MWLGTGLENMLSRWLEATDQSSMENLEEEAVAETILVGIIPTLLG